MTNLHFTTSDLEKSMAFYRALLDREPKKRYDDLAIFELGGLSIELSQSTIAVVAGDAGIYGFPVPSADTVRHHARRLKNARVPTDLRVAESCCHSIQTKVYTVDPDGRRWKTYAILDAVADERPWNRFIDSWRSHFHRAGATASDVVTDEWERKVYERELRKYPRGFGTDVDE